MHEVVDTPEEMISRAKQWVKDNPEADPALGPEGLQDPRRHAVDAEVRGEPARVPGQPAQAAQERPDAGAVQHHVRRGRGLAGRHRQRRHDRVALLRRARLRAGVDEHDARLLLRPAGHQQGRLAPRRLREAQRPQGRRARRRDDGRGHRVHRARWRASRSSSRTSRRRTPTRARRTRRRSWTRPSRAASQTQEKADEVLARITPTADAGRRRGRRPRHRGRLREPGPQEAGLRRGHAAPGARRGAGLEHLDAADHRPRERRRPARGLHRPALLLAGRQDAAPGDHPRREDERRDAGQGRRHRAADQEDPDRRLRQPRVLHQPRHRHVHQRGRGHARRGRRAVVDRAGRLAGRLPGPAAAADGRADPHAAAAHPPGDPQGRRGGRRHLGGAPLRGDHRPHGRARPQGPLLGRRVLRVRRVRQAHAACGRACPRSSARRRATCRSRTCRSACSSPRPSRP